MLVRLILGLLAAELIGLTLLLMGIVNHWGEGRLDVRSVLISRAVRHYCSSSTYTMHNRMILGMV